MPPTQADIDEGITNGRKAWYHVLEHFANYMGQIALVKKQAAHN